MREIWSFERPLDDDAGSAGSPGRFEEGFLVRAGLLEKMQQLKLLFYESALRPFGEHGVEKDDIRPE